MGNEPLTQVLIVGIAPYFLEKELFWFEENLENILESAATQTFFKENTVFLKAGQPYPLMELLQKFDQMGYEKVFTVKEPGEFSHTGGIVEVFPVNTKHAVRLDFLGNAVETIRQLKAAVEDEAKSRKLLTKKLQSQKLFSDVKNLKPGDYVVHLDHGVAVFAGIENVVIENEKTGSKTEASYYVLAYANNDKLFVPVGLERKLSRYIGFADPAVSRLASALWQNTKRKIKEDVEKLARELLELYSQKEVVERPPYRQDNDMEQELLAGFEHQETPDQLQAIEDIKKDLSQAKPMDRIVCGDVGFGKTEIAMRAAFMAGINGRQCAIICPTTILASQHYQNFKKRFAKLPFTIALLSRLQTKQEQRRLVDQVKDGGIDIIIGTHRVLSKDLSFKNLQLLIIDDEQRFGVKQKEKLRQQNPALDILSLSATPIPRTIWLALSSFKNISLMQTPPRGRIAIHTSILPYGKRAIRQAILQELGRGGQVYFLHNRVQTIDGVKASIRKLVPDATIETIHGRMNEKEIMRAMERFSNRKTNVLIATTIIENGIDLPNVNTIIIEDASRLGLAQAYQIRGRVGRSHLTSFAYLFYPKHLTLKARQRLEALGQAKELGAGYQIALRDLELRGAGNILGREQSGSINKIGLNLYCQMLADAVEKLR